MVSVPEAPSVLSVRWLPQLHLDASWEGAWLTALGRLVQRGVQINDVSGTTNPWHFTALALPATSLEDARAFMLINEHCADQRLQIPPTRLGVLICGRADPPVLLDDITGISPPGEAGFERHYAAVPDDSVFIEKIEEWGALSITRAQLQQTGVPLDIGAASVPEQDEPTTAVPERRVTAWKRQ